MLTVARRTGWVAVVSLVVALGVAAPALAAQTRSSGSVTVARGTLTPDGLAEVTGALPPGRAFTPASYALSHDARFGPGDLPLGTGKLRAKRARFDAWVALPDAATVGASQLLACRGTAPSRSGCVSVGRVKVRAAPAIPAATPVLDQAHTASVTVGLPGGDVSLTTADGTTFVLHIPQHATPGEPVTMTAVTALTPTAAAGRLVAGVVIEPQDIAPLGTTLEIKRSAWPKGARAVAFGTTDPSGGAFPIPGQVRSDMTLPVTNFGGYGVAVAAGGRAADAAARPVACSRPAPWRGTSASARARASSGSRPLLSCVAIAEKLNALQRAAETVIKGGANPALLYALFASAANALAAEIAPIVSQPPTESGAEELQLLLPLAIGMQRQTELAPNLFPPAALGPLAHQLALAYGYGIRLIRSICQGPDPHPAGVYIDYWRQAFGLLRQQVLLGQGTSQVQPILEACLRRIKLQLTGKIEATADHQNGGGWTGHVKAHMTATIVGNASSGGLESDTPAFEFDTKEATADPGFAAIGGTAQMTSAQGKFQPDVVNAWVTRKVKCDKNRHFVIERKVFMEINAFGLWSDTEQVQLAVNGSTGGLPPFPEAAASIAWGQDYRSRSQRIQMEVDKDTVTKTNSGTCSTFGECSTFSYNATLAAQQLNSP